MTTIRRLIKSIFRKIGFELRRYNPKNSDHAKLMQALNFWNIDFVLDIGANTGQFAIGLRENGYNNIIVSVEPLSDVHNDLILASQGDLNWIVHERCAVGTEDGFCHINVSKNSVSSSVLGMLPEHSLNAPESSYVGTELVPLTTIDAVVFGHYRKSSNLLLKIDTQGYEWEALEGAKETLSVATAVLIELSLCPLYDGQRIWLDIIKKLESHGFGIWWIGSGFSNLENGRVLQIDALFVKENS